MEDVVITSALRTPMGGFQGDLDSFSASELGGKAIKGAMEQAGVDRVDEVLMGNVLGAGQGQAPARQASFAATQLFAEERCDTFGHIHGDVFERLTDATEAAINSGANADFREGKWVFSHAQQISSNGTCLLVILLTLYGYY